MCRSCSTPVYSTPATSRSDKASSDATVCEVFDRCLYYYTAQSLPLDTVLKAEGADVCASEAARLRLFLDMLLLNVLKWHGQ
jgi:hypothetical protein